MPQSSLMTWLNKPRTVIEPPRTDGKPERQLESGLKELPTTPSTNHEPAPEDGKQTPSLNTPAKNKAHPSLSALPSHLPPNVDFRSCTKDDIFHLKRLTSLLLPIPYPDNFYREVIEDPLTNNITLIAVWHDDPTLKGKEKGRLVGAIRCRLLAHDVQDSSQNAPMLYLSTLVLLSPYRSHGIASQMLKIITKRAIEGYGISKVGAHVWVANAEGLDWYRERGFREVGKESGYYRRLDPKDAVVMQKDVGPSDLLPG